MDRPSTAQILLAAAQFATTSELAKLETLIVQNRDIFPNSLVYRLLYTFLPTDTIADCGQDLVKILRDVGNDFRDFSLLDNHVQLDLKPAKDAENILRTFVLDQIPTRTDSETDDLTDFSIALLQKIESIDGISPVITDLFSQFTFQSPALRSWIQTYLLPLSKLQNDFYPEQAGYLTTADLEQSRGVFGVSQLLSFAEHVGPGAQIGRDIDQVVSPWVRGSRGRKRRKLDLASDDLSSDTSFRDVDEWIIRTAAKDYTLASDAVLEWDGPTTEDDVDDAAQEENIHFIQTVIATAYLECEGDKPELRRRQVLAARAAELAQLLSPDFNTETPNISELSVMTQASRADLLNTALLKPRNPVTSPSTDSIELLYAVLATQNILGKYQLDSTTSGVAQCALFASADQQLQELRRLLNQIPRLTRNDLDWGICRKHLLWLGSWQEPAQALSEGKTAYLGKISVETLEREILRAMLAANQFQTVKTNYLTDDESPLPVDVVRETVLAAIYDAYDNASNGNKTRGGMKRACDLLRAFESSFTDATEFEHVQRLINATHSLSFYQLTLQHGVPFQPVSIRVSKDPLSLLGKVLEQNDKAYTNLDDLLGIARNLVLAELPNDNKSNQFADEDMPLERRLLDAEHRVTYLAIDAALSDHDFDTAYSLIVTRFINQTTNLEDEDDISWRAAYAAGKYRPASAPSNVHDRISSAAKRLELLSQALRLAPASNLPEILATWRRSEEEMDSLKSQAVQEERALDSQGGDQIPGGFGQDDQALDSAESKRWAERRAFNATRGPSYEEEAPVGLFDMARGAASSIRKSAFPLRGANTRNLKVVAPPRASQDGHGASGDWNVPGSPDSEGQPRTRKRDMLSNAVTGSLVTGMGWVLGAKPVEGREGQ